MESVVLMHGVAHWHLSCRGCSCAWADLFQLLLLVAALHITVGTHNVAPPFRHGPADVFDLYVHVNTVRFGLGG